LVFWPFSFQGVTLVSLVMLFGFYAILDGVFDIVSAIKAPGHHWPLLVEGIVGIVAGIVTFMWPGITAMVLLYLIGFWAILTGVLEIVAGIRLREVIANESLLILMGAISTLFGILIILFPGAMPGPRIRQFFAQNPDCGTTANALNIQIRMSSKIKAVFDAFLPRRSTTRPADADSGGHNLAVTT
jgi:hypothetical protein